MFDLLPNEYYTERAPCYFSKEQLQWLNNKVKELKKKNKGKRVRITRMDILRHLVDTARKSEQGGGEHREESENTTQTSTA